MSSDMCENRLCCVCYNRESEIRCDGCKKYATCIDCINNLKSRQHYCPLFDFLESNKRIHEILSDNDLKELSEQAMAYYNINHLTYNDGSMNQIYIYKDEHYPVIQFQCPLCRHNNRLKLFEKKYTKEQVLRFTYRDYAKITQYENKEKIYEDVILQFINIFRDLRNDTERRENAILSIHNAHLMGTNRDLKNEIRKHKQTIEDLKSENTKLKHQISIFNKEYVESMIKRLKSSFNEIKTFTKDKRSRFLDTVERTIKPLFQYTGT